MDNEHLELETLPSTIGQLQLTEKQIVQKQYQYYSFGEFQFYCLVCMKGHFFLVSLKFNATDVKKQIFYDVKVYDSMKYVNKGRAKKTLPFHTGSSPGIYLITLQKFLSTYVFHNSQLNDILLTDKHYILKDAKFISCPCQTNSFDCSFFGLGTMLHAIHGLPIDDTIFYQEHITLFRKELHRTLSSHVLDDNVPNPLTSLTKEFMISFFPKVYDHYMERTNIESDYFIQTMRKK
jgi:hypothetical protein